MVDVIKAIEQFLLPQLNEIKGEIKALDTRIDNLEKTVNIRFDSLSEKIDIIKEMEQLKSKVAQLEARH